MTERIFTHPNVRQAGDYGLQYEEDLMCSVCRCNRGKHCGWACPGASYLGSLPDQPTTVSHRCARCNATLDEASVEGHAERCFVVGDWVRGEWRRALHVIFEGEVVSKPAMIDGRLNIGIRIASSNTFTVDSERHFFRLEPGDLRRIQRPGLAVKVTGYTSKPITVTKQELDDARDNSLGLYECAAGLPPPGRKFDGITEEQCSVRWEINRHHVERGLPAPSAMTVKQIAAAKAAWVRDVGVGQSEQLRARIDAAREQERVRVQIDADPDDTPW